MFIDIALKQQIHRLLKRFIPKGIGTVTHLQAFKIPERSHVGGQLEIDTQHGTENELERILEPVSNLRNENQHAFENNEQTYAKKTDKVKDAGKKCIFVG